MNRDAMVSLKRPALALAAVAYALLAACNDMLPTPADPPPLQGAAIGGDFTLTAEDGQPVSFSDFDGKYRTIYFGYAFCPDACPTDNQRAMAGLKLFEREFPQRGAMVQPLFVSIDPARDTPEVLREFTDNFHPRLIGMTGPDEVLKGVVKDYAGTYSQVPTSNADGYLMDHPLITYLMGPDGKPIAFLPTDQGPEAVAAELEKWVH
ncbi:SCO family protein [Qipengyuania sp. 6B39]|uniref:SCO family protein n=1 Tax=Qipengyuania proteolytica TaxID=2867239 RepID=UPI001C8AA48E|nr:SCO family protein [Qipengyuania proteolytica]MBX7495141.1 SCO family protein [Qipengyuania proteolytica]